MRQPLTYDNKIVAILRRGGVGVLPTDTLYGLVGLALSKDVVARIYALRHRNPKKPMIILIASMADLKKFGVQPSPQIKRLLKQWWPGKVSAILPTRKFSYLHRGTGTLAFRLPSSEWLRAFLRKTGPLIAPSANLEGKPPAKTIREAVKYFGNRVDFYCHAGRLNGNPSTLVNITRGKIIVLRPGAVKIKTTE